MKFFASALAAAFLCAATIGAAEAAPKAPAKTEAKAAKPGFVAADSKLLVVFANPGEGKEAEFNVWYDKHMQDFMKFPNFVRVQKFKMLARKGRPDPAYKYMFLFEFKGDQDESFAQIQAAMKNGGLDVADPKVVAKIEGSNYGADGLGYRGPAAE
jgi:hypothetical protein